MRVSVTDIDQWRYWKDAEDMELSDLLARLRRQGEESEAMRAGIALHRALELAGPSESDSLECGGYTFTFECECALALPAAREVKVSKSIMVGDTEVTLIGKVDAWQGLTVYDHKTTSQIDAERFMSSYQWRFYLWMFNARQFVWNIFQTAPDPKTPRAYRVREFQQLTQWAYPALADDCMRELSEFVEFARETDAYGTEPSTGRLAA